MKFLSIMRILRRGLFILQEYVILSHESSDNIDNFINLEVKPVQHSSPLRWCLFLIERSLKVGTCFEFRLFVAVTQYCSRRCVRDA